jgi:hypothetical protein
VLDALEWGIAAVGPAPGGGWGAGKVAGVDCHRESVQVRTSVIPLRCWRRYRTVQAMRRGFLRWRKSDSDLPFWNRKILESPRT